MPETIEPATPVMEDFWALFPGLPRKAVITAMRIIEDNQYESSVSRIREIAHREASDEFRAMHERHINLMAHCYLCRLEAGAQTDRLSNEEDPE
jgi:hypothetical protein